MSAEPLAARKISLTEKETELSYEILTVTLLAPDT